MIHLRISFLFLVSCFLFLSPVNASQFNEQRIVICNDCNFNLNTVALQAALSSPSQAATLHIIKNSSGQHDMYEVEYFPEMRYFHVQSVSHTNNLTAEIDNYLAAVQVLTSANFDPSTLPHRSAWDLAGSPGNQAQVAEQFMNSRTISESLLIYNQFIHRKVHSILVDTSDILIQRWVFFNDGTRALVNIKALGIAGESSAKIIALRTDEGKVIPMTEEDVQDLNRVAFEFKDNQTLRRFVDAMAGLNVSVPDSYIMEAFLRDNPGGSVTITDCHTQTCKSEVNPN